MNATLTLNSPATRTPVVSKPNRGWIRWLIVAVSIPLCIAVVLAIAVGIREYNASRKINALIAEWKRTGVPYDDASMSAWYKAKTRSEGAADWLQVIYTIESITPIADIGHLPIVGNSKEPPSLDPSQPWPEDAAVADFLKELEPVLEKLHQLGKYPTPVRFPIEFNGFGTLLHEYQAARSIQRVLQLDCEYAYVHGQTDRAMQDLRSMLLLSKAMDSDICLVSDLIVVAFKNSLYRTVQRTLEVDHWSNEQLNALRTLDEKPHFTADKWSRIFAGERGMAVEAIVSGSLHELVDRSAPPMPLMQTGRLKLLEMYDPIQQLGYSNLESLCSSCMNFQSGLLVRDATWDTDVSMFYAGSLLGSTPQMAQAFQSLEDDRRLTLTAIALRQFKKSEGHWPSRLSELEKVGLTSSDYNTLTAGELGYTIEDESYVYLWRHAHYRETRVSPTRPKIDGSEFPLHMVRLK